MKKNTIISGTNRREFLSSLATGAATVSLASLASSLTLQAKPIQLTPTLDVSTQEDWFDKIKGKHKMVFDAVSANEGLSIVWSYTFMTTHNQTGTADGELTAMIVLRSKAICLAMNDTMWGKYKLGKIFKLIDPSTNAPSERNLYWSPQEGEMPQYGMSIKDLQTRGAMFCVCETALTLNSSQYAKGKGMNAAEVKNDWISGLLPGIQLVPSGVWALSHAQEKGCSYCNAG